MLKSDSQQLRSSFRFRRFVECSQDGCNLGLENRKVAFKNSLDGFQININEDKVFDSSLLVSPDEIIRSPKSRMGFLAMTGKSRNNIRSQQVRDPLRIHDLTLRPVDVCVHWDYPP